VLPVTALQGSRDTLAYLSYAMEQQRAVMEANMLISGLYDDVVLPVRNPSSSKVAQPAARPARPAPDRRSSSAEIHNDPIVTDLTPRWIRRITATLDGVFNRAVI